MKIRELLMQETLPRKDFFRSQEVATLLGVKQHEIRYWESEFPQIKSQKTRKGKRIYRREDVILFGAIKHLLLEKKLTLAGAQRIIAESDEVFAPLKNTSDCDEAAKEVPPPAAVPSNTIDEVMHSSSVIQDVMENDRVLEEASKILEKNNEEFDDFTHRIYQQCSDDLDEAQVEIQAEHVGEMIHDALMTTSEQDKTHERLSKLEYEKTVAMLVESKNSLTQLLTALDKYHESDFYQGLRELSENNASQKRRVTKYNKH